MTSFSAPMMGVASYNWYPLMILVFIGNIVTTALHLLAFRPLLKRAKKGWNLLFYATVFSVIFVLVQIIFGSSEVLNIVSSLLNLWLLFEVRELYKA